GMIGRRNPPTGARCIMSQVVRLTECSWHADLRHCTELVHQYGACSGHAIPEAGHNGAAVWPWHLCRGSRGRRVEFFCGGLLAPFRGSLVGLMLAARNGVRREGHLLTS